MADQLFPNATNYIVPDTAGTSAVVVDQGKNYYIIFDLFGYASACSKLVKVEFSLESFEIYTFCINLQILISQ